jgi:hypothetical protein
MNDLAGETEVLGENLPMPLCSSQVPLELPGLESVPPATNRLS